MPALATLSFQSSHPIDINWGDGTTDLAIATSPAKHLYATTGAKTVTLTDPVNGQSSAATLVACGPIDWIYICNSYPSWTALAAANPAWTDVLNG